MSARCFLILAVYTLGSSGLLTPPSHVRLTSYNMDLVLRWDPSTGEPGNMLYNAQYGLMRQSDVSWQSACVNTSLLECVLSGPASFSSSISVFGRYRGRVQTLRGEELSVWEESEVLMMDKETVIGPPSVSLVSNGGNMEVSITDPEFSISSLRNVYPSPTYNITYWREEHPQQAKSLPGILQDRFILKDLDVWTNYCVHVQIHTELNMQPSRASEPVCERTNNRDKAPWVTAVVTFVVIAVVAAMVTVAVVYRKKISHFFCPKVSLPQHFQHILTSLDIPFYHHANTNDEFCHPVSVHAHSLEQHHSKVFKTEEEQRSPEVVSKGEEQYPPDIDRTEEEKQSLGMVRTEKDQSPP